MVDEIVKIRKIGTDEMNEHSRLYPCQIAFDTKNCRRTDYAECNEIYVCSAYKLNLKEDQEERNFWLTRKDRIEDLLK